MKFHIQQTKWKKKKKKKVPKIEACLTENFLFTVKPQSLRATVPAYSIKDPCWFSRGCYTEMNPEQVNPTQSLTYEHHQEQINSGQKNPFSWATMDIAWGLI